MAHERLMRKFGLMAAALAAAAATVALALTLQSGCGYAVGAAPCTHVLFIGNSYTSVNDLPTTFAKLARSGGHRVETGRDTVDGSTLAEHAASVATATALAGARWDIVVLQEQSEIPSVDQLRRSQMYPAARTLIEQVRHSGAHPMLFMTWGHRDGWPQNGLVGYGAMQAAISDGYLAIGKEEGVEVAPVGAAWQLLAAEQANPPLWQDDGSHPTIEGTYLAACVFYATIFRKSPVGLSYHDGLSDADAATLQEVAATTVLTHAATWGLN